MKVTQRFNAVYKPVFTTGARYIHILGGRGRGGSHFATDYFLYLLTRPEYFRGYFLREVLTDVRESLFKDFKDRIAENPNLDEQDFIINEQMMSVVCLSTGNELLTKGFRKSSGARTAKMKSLAGCTHCIIEEAEEVSEEDFMQLDDTLRTIKADLQIIMIFNPPPRDHWINKRWYDLEPSRYKNFYHAIPVESDDFLSIFSTYQDNTINLNESTLKNYQRYKITNFDYWATVIEGLVSETARGIIFDNVHWVDEFPSDCKWVAYGLDFGYSNAFTALPKVGIKGDDLYVDLLLYERGLVNVPVGDNDGNIAPNIHDEMEKLGLTKHDEIYADSAEAKSIMELQLMGWNVYPVKKGDGSIVEGIDILRRYRIHITNRSEGMKLETRNYKWLEDRDGELMNKPVDKYNDGWDAIRYVALMKLAVEDEGFFMQFLN